MTDTPQYWQPYNDTYWCEECDQEFTDYAEFRLHINGHGGNHATDSPA